MNPIITADLHHNPGDIFRTNLRAYNPWIDIGDMCNIIPYGMKPWRTKDGRKTIESIANNCTRGIFIWENHGGHKEWMQELFKPYPHITIVDDYEFVENGRIYKFKHGSEYTDWRLWQVGADDITAWMTRFPWLRSLWYRYCIWKGWMPSHYRDAEVTLTDKILGRDPQRKYEALIGAVHTQAIREADNQRVPCSLYYGHTHRYIKTVTDQGNEAINMRNRQMLELVL